MTGSTTSRLVRVGAFFGFVAAVCSAVSLAAGVSATSTGHMDKLLSLNCKFVGAGTCASGSCHGGGNKETPPKKIGSESSVWEAKDAHAKAAVNLTKPNLKEHPWMSTIAAKLSITGDLSKSDRCAACHSGAAVPANLQGDKFAVSEGVSCYQCHGPAEKWLVPHATKGWTEEQRKKLDHDGLLKTHGLFDTKPVGPRADMCASCHLAIDEKLVQAGHPQPIFEQLTYQSSEPEHWIEHNAGFGRLNLWAAGQIVGLRESVAQSASRTDAALVAASKQQAVAHLMMVQTLVETNVVPGDAAKLKAAVETPDAKAIAELTEPMLAAVNKLDAKGDKAQVLAVLKKLAALDPKAVNAAGRRGVEQTFFGLERLLLAYRDGANIARDAFTPVRTSIKPLRDLKLYETRFDTKVPDAKAVETSLPAAAKAIDGLK